jgi:hypothetical protein
VGVAVLLLGCLAAVTGDAPSNVMTVLLGGTWLTFVLAAMTPDGADGNRRLANFRHEVSLLGDEPSRADLGRLLALARELGLPEEDISNELARIRASLAALSLRERVRRGDWPGVATPEPLPSGDVCHFLAPVRFGRRRADQYGHLLLTRTWLTFRGALDISVAWSEVSSVERADRELIVRLNDSRRLLRFSCHTVEEAACGGVLAIELAEAASPRSAHSANGHAAV